MTAWERWELASLDEPAPSAEQPAAADSSTDMEPPVRLPTAAEIEQIRQLAHQEGYREGRQAGQQEGYQAGYAEGQGRARDEASRLAQLAEKLDQAMAGFEEQVAEELLQLAVELARQVIRSEIAARPETLLDVIREALTQLPHQHAAIYLNPEDASLARSYFGDQLTHSGHRIHEDSQLGRGDCVLEAGGSHVDATVATRWRRTLEGLGLDAAWEAPKPK